MALEGTGLSRLALARTLSEQWGPKRDAVTSTPLAVWMTWWRDVQLSQLGLAERAVHSQPAEVDVLAKTKGQRLRDGRVEFTAPTG